MKKLFLCITLTLMSMTALFADKRPENSDDRMYCHRNMSGVRNNIAIPDIDGYLTLKCDFHMHTVYADAQVSPKGRVQEAWYDGLDVVSVTEHAGVHKTGIEFNDFNLVNKLAMAAGEELGMIVIPGIEITRAKPFGHMNFLFIKDGNAFSDKRYALDKNGKTMVDKATGYTINDEETLKSDLAAAIEQDCFIQWNHPGWPDKICDMFDIHREMIAKGQINSVEICNSTEWYPKVLDWFDEFHIPMVANSDQHPPISYTFGHVIRPMTLVFAKEYTMESIREAMFAGRMVAFWDQTLAGDASLLEALVHSCLKVKVIDAKKGKIEVTNISDIQLETLYGDHMSPVIFYPHTARIVTVKEGEKINFINCYIGRRNLSVNLW